MTEEPNFLGEDSKGRGRSFFPYFWARVPGVPFCGWVADPSKRPLHRRLVTYFRDRHTTSASRLLRVRWKNRDE